MIATYDPITALPRLLDPDTAPRLDGGVDQCLKVPPGGRIRHHNRSKPSPVQVAVRQEHVAAEAVRD